MTLGGESLFSLGDGFFQESFCLLGEVFFFGDNLDESGLIVSDVIAQTDHKLLYFFQGQVIQIAIDTSVYLGYLFPYSQGEFWGCFSNSRSR